MHNALREVEDALVAYRTDRTARDRLANSVRSAKLTLYLARNQCSHGLTVFIQVLDAERTLVSQRQQSVQADMQIADDVVALYRALGDGWEQSAGDVKTPPVPALPPIVPRRVEYFCDARCAARALRKNTRGQPH